VAGKGKGRSGERPFLFLTLYYQNTKWSVKTCQIFLGFLAWKWLVFMGHYFGLEACLLTKDEEKAKGGRKSGELAGQQVGELAVSTKPGAGSLEPVAGSPAPGAGGWELVAGSW
jgi:hypothetical protein